MELIAEVLYSTLVSLENNWSLIVWELSFWLGVSINVDLKVVFEKYPAPTEETGKRTEQQKLTCESIAGNPTSSPTGHQSSTYGVQTRGHNEGFCR